MKYFKVIVSQMEIVPIEVDRETKTHVVINGTMVAKEQVGRWYVPTYEAAKEALIKFYEDLLVGINQRKQFLEEKLKEVKAL